MSYRIPILFLISIILVSCGVNTSDIKYSTATPEKTRVTPALIEEVPLVTASAEKKKCIDLTEDERLRGGGYLILSDMLKSADEPFSGSGIIMNTSTFESTLVDKPDWYPDISPSGNAIAFLDHENSSTKLVVSTKAKTYILPNDKFTYLYWVNEDIVAIKEDYKPNTYTLLLNPFSGKSERLETNFPEMSDLATELINPWAGRVTSFNVLLTHVIYPTKLGSNFLDLNDGTILRNIPLTPHYYSPAWSPKGDRFLIGFPIGGNSELASISVNNDVIMLTNFSSIYSSFAVNSYSWSPDGQRIAFWFSQGDYYSNNSYKSLAFIDLIKDDLTITCLLSQSFIFDSASDLVWSPDSRQVATKFYPIRGEPSLKALIDVGNLSYRIIPDDFDLTPKGWLTFKPEIE